MEKKSLMALVFGLGLLSLQAQSLSISSLGDKGEGGTKNNREFLIGDTGSVFELDAFVNVAGLDLNGTATGTSARLSRQPLPPEIGYAFTYAVASNSANAVLTYKFTNQGQANLRDLRLFVLLDTEIREAADTFFNEYGVVTGTPGRGPADALPDSWQVDEPGYRGGTLVKDIMAGRLRNVNTIPDGAPNDVALALGFHLGSLKPAQSISARVMIAADGSSFPGFALTHRNLQPNSTTTATLSGDADLSESPFIDATGTLKLSFQWTLDEPSGSLVGRLQVENPAESSASFSAPVQLAIAPADKFRFVQPTGTMDDGQKYLDLTAEFQSQVGADGELKPGQTVVFPDVRVYSGDRSAPPTELFSIWATQSK